MQSRVVAYKGDHYLQHFLNGKWATIGQTDLPLTMSTSTLTTGSQHSHARLAPSDAKCWLSCTAAIAFRQQNEDRIFEDDVRSVIKLTPYLKSLPPEEVFEHEGRAMRWARDVREGRVAAKDLTPAQKEDIRKSEGNEYSREGTRAHEFATQIFAGEKTLADIPEDFRQPVGFYIDFCMGFLEHDMEPFIVETKVPLFYDRESTGTRDFAIVRENRITIIDYKHGQGEPVDAVKNPQCAIYGLSTVADLEHSGMFDFDPKKTIVDIWIVQPRYHGDRPAKQWEVSLAELREFGKEIQETHDRIVAGEELEFAPSKDVCQWCKCKAFCPAKAGVATSMLSTPEASGLELLCAIPEISEIPGTKTKKEFNSRDAAEKVKLRVDTAGWPLPLTDDIMVALRRKKAAIIEFLNDVAEHVNDRVLAGEELEGLKIVMGTAGDREWLDEEAADKYLENRLKANERYVKKLISPTKAEKLIDLKKEKPRFVNGFNNLIVRAAAGKVVVDIDDKRDAVPSDFASPPDAAGFEEEPVFPEGM